MPQILLVHVNTDDRAMYAEFLRAHEVDVAESGTTDDAFTMLDTGDWSLLITGVRVPGRVTGSDFISSVRAHSPTLPIIVVTADIGRDVRAAVEAAGCDAYFLKPCLPEVLLMCIRGLLR